MSAVSAVRMTRRILLGAMLIALSAPLYCAEADSTSEPIEEATSLAGHEINVVTFSKKNGAKPEDDATFSACNDWRLTAAGIAEFFSNAKPIAPETEHHSYAWFPCQFAGTLLVDGKPFRFEINAASTGWLESQATTDRKLVIYGCMQTCANLFPTAFRDTYEGED